jgi:arylsulfatase A-like enzyme
MINRSFTLAVVLLGAWMIASARAADTRPNIIYIMADDHGRQAISCYGSVVMKTPNIDRIAAGGMRFTQMLATNSMCSPSRATLLTGKYNNLCGVEKLNQHFDGSQETFPKLLQQAGYETAIVGKWHLFTEPTGFDYYCVMPGQGRYNDCPLKETGQPWGNGDAGGVVHPGYLTDVITDVALNWLKNRKSDKPFCLMIHHKAPHSPHDPAPRFANLFKNTVFPDPENLLDDYKGRAPEPVADLLNWSRLILGSKGDIDVRGGDVKKLFNGDRSHDTEVAYQGFMRGYLELVAALDENVGRVLDYVDQSGLAKNTIIVYTSDNGYFLGEHGFYNKMWMYEESLHLPLLVRGPGIAPGSTNSEMVSMLDMAPTLLDLAGVKVPAEIQGVSMKPLLMGQPAQGRDAFYYHYYGAAGAPVKHWIGSHEIMGVRTKMAKLVLYPTWKSGPFWELFDLQNDPHEMLNLYSDPAHLTEVAEMKQRLRDLAVHYKDTAGVALLDQIEAQK